MMTPEAEQVGLARISDAQRRLRRIEFLLYVVIATQAIFLLLLVGLYNGPGR